MMFVQIIEGHTSDAEGLRRRGEAWQQDLRAGAEGYLGITSGVTADGHAITIVRFESEEAARANSARPEQGAWWAETEKCYDGPVAFVESSDVHQSLGGGSDDARFVQVMKSTGVDRQVMERLDEQFERFAGARPELLGAFRVWTGPDACYEIAYFTSEAEARVGEQAEPPAELAELMGEFQRVLANTEFIDLVDPELR